MGQKPKILVDTNLLILAFRGKEEAKEALTFIEDRIAISVITYIEMLVGAKTTKRIFSLNKELQPYPVYYLNEAISRQALLIAKSYTGKHPVRIADALIAATALHHQLPLFTYNKKDFDFIKGLSLYEPA